MSVRLDSRIARQSEDRTKQPFFTCEIPERKARRKPVLSLYPGVFNQLDLRAVAGPLSPFGLQRDSRRVLRPRRLVEPDGIEPTTSCLQSTRSPN